MSIAKPPPPPPPHAPVQRFSGSVILTLLILLALCTATADGSTAAIDAISTQIGFFRLKIPRLAHDLSFVSPRFQPESTQYWSSLLILCAFGIVMLTVAIVVSFVFDPIRSMGCCGGKEPMKGFFRGPARKKPYPRWQVLGLKAIVVLLSVVLAAICVGGIVANIAFNESFEQSRLTLRNTTLTVFTKIEGIRDTLIDLRTQSNTTNPELDSAVQAFSELVATQSDAANATITISRDIGRVNRVRYIALFVALAFSLFAPLLIIISGLFNLTIVNIHGQTILWYLIIALWALYLIHFPIAILAGDICEEIDTYVQNYNSTATPVDGGGTNTPIDPNTPENTASQLFNQAEEVLNLIMRCAGNQTLLGGVLATQGAVDSMLDEFNYALALMSGDSNNTFSYTVDDMHQAKDLDFVKNNADYLHAVDQTIVLIENFVHIFAKMDELLMCTDVAAGFAEIRESSCVNLLRSTDILWLTFLLLAVGESGILVLGILGYKRWRKRKYVVPSMKRRGKRGFVHVTLDGKNSSEGDRLLNL